MTEPSNASPILVIGAGIVGLCAAESLLRENPDREITVLSREFSGASFGNGGIIVPSHFVPLADPGLLRSGLKMMLSPKAPFGLQKLPDLEMIGWVMKFMGSATNRKAEAAGPLLRDLNLASRAAYESLIQRLDLKVGYDQKGLIMLCQTQKALDAEAHLAEQAQKLGLGASVLSAAEIEALEPKLTIRCAGGVYFKDDAHLTPGVMMEALRKSLESRGVKFITGTAKRFIHSGGQIEGIETKTGETLKAGHYIVASGVWATKLAQTIGAMLPMLSGKGYGITEHSPSEPLSHPMILTEARVAVTPMLDGVRFVGTLELGPPSETINSNRVDGFLDSVGSFLPAFSKLQKSDVWVGNRPCTPDGMPYIGQWSGLPNITFATGHAMMGMSLGPITGDLVADLVSGRKPRLPLDLLSPQRFA